MPARIHLVVKLHYSVLKVHANNMHVEYMQSRVPVVTWNCPLGYKFVRPGQLAVPALFKNLIGQFGVIHIHVLKSTLFEHREVLICCFKSI